MSNILNPDNAFFSTINKIIDVIWIGLLWSICSFPILGAWTLMSGVEDEEMLLAAVFWVGAELLVKSPLIGPATTALYYVMVKVIRRERGYATKEFFHAFKQNFKCGAITSLCFAALGALMYVDFKYAGMITSQGSSYGSILSAALMCVCIFALLILIWIFPILSRFQVGFKALVRNSLMLSIRHILSSLLMIAFLGAYIYVIVNYVPAAFYLMIPVLVPGPSMLVRSFIIEPVFKKYMGESEGNPEETGVDEWYRE